MPQTAKDRMYHDADELTVEHRVDFDDPIERAAIAMHRAMFATVAEVASLLDSEHGRGELRYTWLRLSPGDRRLWRRRVAVAFPVAAE